MSSPVGLAAYFRRPSRLPNLSWLRGVAAVSLLWLAATPARAQEKPTAERCIACHRQLRDARLSAPAKTFSTDIHAQKGLGCLACHGLVARHGGDPRDITPGTGFLSRPDRRDIPAMCGRCHSDASYMKRFDPMLRVDEVSEYRTSVHGKRLMEDGDTAVATCIDCHPAHRILPPSDPASSVYPTHVAETCGRCHSDPARMARYDLPTNQVEKWKKSVHGQQMLKKGDTSAPTCNDCHGNHGAVPPGVSDVPHVCGQCHSTIAQTFAANQHDSVFAANALPGCVTCHSNHEIEQPSDSLLVARAHTVCERCHEAGGAEARQFLVIRQLIDSLQAAGERSEAVIKRADYLGMDVSQAQFQLSDVTTDLTKARNAVHSFRADSVAAPISAGLKTADDAASQGRAALVEHRFRRVGLGLSVPVILGLAGGLWLRLRSIEEDGSEEDDDDDPRHHPTGSEH